MGKLISTCETETTTYIWIHMQNLLKVNKIVKKIFWKYSTINEKSFINYFIGTSLSKEKHIPPVTIISNYLEDVNAFETFVNKDKIFSIIRMTKYVFSFLPLHFLLLKMLHACCCVESISLVYTVYWCCIMFYVSLQPNAV